VAGSNFTRSPFEASSPGVPEFVPSASLRAAGYWNCVESERIITRCETGPTGMSLLQFRTGPRFVA